MLAADFDGRHLIFKLAENGRTIYRSPEIIRLSERPNKPRATSAQYHLCKTLNDRLPFMWVTRACCIGCTDKTSIDFGAVQLHSHLLLAIQAHIYGYEGFEWQLGGIFGDTFIYQRHLHWGLRKWSVSSRIPINPFWSDIRHYAGARQGEGGNRQDWRALFGEDAWFSFNTIGFWLGIE